MAPLLSTSGPPRSLERASQARASWSRPRGSSPARAAAFVVAALALGALSIYTAAKLCRANDVQELPAEHGQLQQQPVAQQRGQGGTCFERYPWIDLALDVWFAKAWAAANASTQTTEEALQVLRSVTWNNYHPGLDQVTLRLDASTGRVVIDALQIAPPKHEHKSPGILRLLRDAVEVHDAEVARVLTSVGGGRPMHILVTSEAYGITERSKNSKIPAFALCADPTTTDIPIPDYTYTSFPQARYSNSSWPAIQALLQHRSGMVPWHERHPLLFHRHNWGVGPRRSIMPLLQTYANGTGTRVRGCFAEKTATEAFGCELDIADTEYAYVSKGRALPKNDTFVWLDEHCNYKYLLHTAGITFSGGLKYALACGSLVFKFESEYQEFYEPALQDQVHVVKLFASHSGVHPVKLKTSLAPRINQMVQSTINRDQLPPIGRQGQAFVREQLTTEALHCYWLGALQRYARIFFLPDKP